MTLTQATMRQLIEDGLVIAGENDDLQLTDKGKARVAKLLDKLTPGQELMLQLAIGEKYGVRFGYEGAN